ncbi:hypothetical protein MN116_007535 [Schistosoma mekongi]|uniref:Uncharacterized protein n=1 Tax=Schistosoma mekongi TaxID=38744 RepID=A0AAE2D287_SCHME|nr:hypothetical protein MN116_007535 [Schistosoma mekongi]
MDNFLILDEDLFENGEEEESLSPSEFHPNVVGSLDFLSNNEEECLKSSSDWFYLFKKYDDCLECLLRLWDHVHVYDGLPKRITSDAIVRCYVKLNKQYELLPYLQQHGQLSVSHEDYIGHLMLHLLCLVNRGMQDRVVLLQRLLLALPPSFADSDLSVVGRRDLFTQSQLWTDLSVVWNEITEENRSMLYPVWFSKVALLYAELVNINPKVTQISLRWTDESLTLMQVDTCHKLSLRILTTCSSSSSPSIYPSFNSIPSHENDEQINPIGVGYSLPYIPKQKCCSSDNTVNTNSDEIAQVFFQVFIAPFMGIYEKLT